MRETKFETEQMHKALSNLEHLKNKLATEVAPNRELYENWERELLELSTWIATQGFILLNDKLALDNRYITEYQKYKLSKEKCSNAEAEKETEFLLKDEFQKLKTNEGLLQTFKAQYESYRRYAENILKSRMIQEQADMRRQEMTQNIPDSPF